MPELQLTDVGVVGLAIYGIIMISLKVVDVIKDKFNTSAPANDVAQPDKLSVLLENNNKAITELTHFLRTQSEVDKEKDKQVVRQMDTIENKVDKIHDLLTQHCLETRH